MHLAGKWEFPGGKIEKGETTEASIVREIKEYIIILAQPVAKLNSSVNHYPDKSIRLIPFKCAIVEGKISLLEHAEFKWLDKDALVSLDWGTANRKLIEL